MSKAFNSLPPIVTAHQWFDINADGRPRDRRGPMPYASDRYSHTECLLLPLCNPAAAVSPVLNAAFYHSSAERTLSAPVIDAIVVDGRRAQPSASRAIRPTSALTPPSRRSSSSGATQAAAKTSSRGLGSPCRHSARNATSR